MKNIAIIGAGAIGMLFAHHLSNSSPITLYVRRETQKQLMLEQGVTLITNNKSENKKHSIKLLANETEIMEDIIIVTVKQYSLPPIISNLKKYRDKTIIFLQNGMGHIPYLEELKQNNIFVGVVEHGASKVNDTTVIFTGKGQTKLAPFYLNSEQTPTFKKWESEISDFPFIILQDWYAVLGEKLLVNAVINPLTAIYKVENGQLILNKYYLETMRIVFDEAFSVISIGEKEEMWKRVTNICRSTSKNQSSMLRDIEAGRETENEAILGFIINEGIRLNKKLPIIHFLYKAIKGLESDQMNRE